MDEDTAQKLVAVNEIFYQSFAEQFSITRQRLQPGVIKILGGLPPEINLLDLGCGNGELACELMRRSFRGNYLGLDNSRALLKIALAAVGSCGSFETMLSADFLEVDITRADWGLNLPERSLEFVTAFAVLHHIPGKENQFRIIDKIHGLLNPGGTFYFSVWQFLNSERLRKRILPWDSSDISTNQIDPGDYLLDWRRGGVGTRYVHHFSEDDLIQLADDTGFLVIDSFLSDGESGNLGLYHSWQKK